MFTEPLLIPWQTSLAPILKWCHLRFLIYSRVWPCAHIQSSLTPRTAKSKCHFPAVSRTSGGPLWFALSARGRSPATVFGASLSLTAGHRDGLFCIQNTLASCLCQRRFHYLTGDPESLAMIPMATWHTERLDQIGWWCEIMWHERSSSSVVSLCKTDIIPLLRKKDCVFSVWIKHCHLWMPGHVNTFLIFKVIIIKKHINSLISSFTLRYCNSNRAISVLQRWSHAAHLPSGIFAFTWMICITQLSSSSL